RSRAGVMADPGVILPACGLAALPSRKRHHSPSPSSLLVGGKSMSRFKGLAALFVAPPAPLPPPPHTTPRRRFHKGKPFYSDWKAQKEDWQSWLGQDRHTVEEARIVLRLTPLDVRPDGGVVLDMRILSFTKKARGLDSSQRVLEGSALRVTLDKRLHVAK